jgi:acyl-CoA oxidase
MFIPTLLNQTTEEQKKLFLYPALKRQIIGCYAQTEVKYIYIYIFYFVYKF